MANKTTIFLAILTIILGVSYNFIYDYISFYGLFRETPKAYSGDRCRKIEGPESCEDIEIHHESGYAFMACGISELRRTYWYPNTGKSIHYREPIYSYKIDSETLLQLSFKNYPDDEDVALHGLGIYQDPANRNVLYVFLINHKRSGDVVEIFSHTIGSQELYFLETVKHDLIYSPNNLLPVSKNEFYVTNDHYSKNKLMNAIELFTRRPWANVVFHSGVNNKTEIAVDGLCYPNGIAGNWDNSRIYLSTTGAGEFYIYERKHDNKLKLLDTIKIDSGDNISVDDITGEIYLATFPKLLPAIHFFKGYYETRVPSVILKISNNTNEDGTKYSKEIVFQDDGSFFNFATIAAVDRRRNVLLLGSLDSKGVVRCKLEY